MKKIVIVLVAIIGFQSFAQEHEVKLDVFDLAVFKSLDLTYMYILNEESGVGISIFKNLADADNIFKQREDFTITPYYRQYFALGRTENIYAEGFLAINSGRDFYKEEIIIGGVATGEYEEKELKYTDGAFGFVIGKSFISPRGFVLDLYAGVGRNLFDSEGSPSLIPRIGINTGFRF